MKCQINLVSQGRCDRKATESRNTGKTLVQLCKQCDDRVGATVGAYVGQTAVRPADDVVDATMRRNAHLNRDPRRVGGTQVYIVVPSPAAQRQAAATSFQRRAAAVAIPAIVEIAWSTGQDAGADDISVETATASGERIVRAERCHVDQAAAQRQANQLNLERATILEAEAAQLRAAVQVVPND